MDSQTLIIFAAIVLPIIVMLLWWEFRASGCAYGGSHQGKDNWLLMQLKMRVRAYRASRAERDVSDV